MKGRLVELLACPSCGGRFALDADVVQARSPNAGPGFDQEVIEGTLTCTACSRSFPIINAVPRILDAALLQRMETRYPDYFARHGQAQPSTQLGAQTDVPDGDQTESEELGETLESFTRQRLDLAPPGPEFAAQWRTPFAKVAGPRLAGEALAGKLVLDAGSGFGRHLVTAAEQGAEVVGIDLSGGVDVACRNTWHLDRVHVVQTNLYEPPFT